MKRPSILFILPILLAVTYSADAQNIPGTPTAEFCTVAPKTDAELWQLSGRDPEAPGSHDPGGDLVAPDELVAVTETIVMSVACTNANMPLSALALFTDRYLTERFSTDPGVDELGHLLAAASRVSGPAAVEDQLAITRIALAEIYSDGRVAFQVETSNSAETYQDILILANVDGTWLIDEVLLGDEVILKGTPEAGG